MAVKLPSERTIFEASARDDAVRVLSLLSDDTITAAGVDDKSHTPLHWAALNDSRKAAKALVENGAPVNAVEADYRQTPLHWAVLRGHHNMVRLLIHAGASLEEEDSAGCTPIHYGAQYGQVLCTQILLAEGANSQPLDSKGRSPLMWACHLGHPNVARFLISRGNSVNLQDTDEKRTALHWAARSGHRLNCLVLQRCGIDLSIEDQDGRTGAMLARKENHMDVAEELESFESRKKRMWYFWEQRMAESNKETITTVAAMAWSLLFFYFSVLQWTPYRNLLVIQMTLTLLGVYLPLKMAGQKEIGAIIEADLPISGNPAAPSNDKFFTNLTVDPDAKMALPFRAAYSKATGNLVRHFSHYCDLTFCDICSENFRQFLAMVVVFGLNCWIMIFIGVDVASSNPGCPSILKIHLWLWYNMTSVKYILLTIWCMWWLVWVCNATLKCANYLLVPIKNMYIYELTNQPKLRYLQDGLGNLSNPWDYDSALASANAFMRGKFTPDHDMYLYSELKLGQWKHPKDKRSL